MGHDWHSDLPPGTEEMWDMIAKVMLLRAGGSVVIDKNELRRAAETPCQISYDADTGTANFRVEPTA